MEVKAVIKQLLEIKNAYPSLTNAEILKVMELKILLEIKVRLSK